MGAADQASNEIIHYLPTVFQGHTINMQTMYMSWLTMVIVILIVVAATRKRDLIPTNIQNIVKIFIK